MRSQYKTIAQSLLDCGHTVDVLLMLNSRSCANQTLVDRLASWHAGLVRHVWNASSTTQARNVRAALDAFSPVAQRYDVLILTRYDLLLKLPMHEWPGCQEDDGTIGFADQCEGFKWPRWNCTGDTMFVIPRPLLWAFDAAVNAVSSGTINVYDHWDARARQRVYGNIMPSACFMTHGELTTRSFPHGLGHGCFNAVAERIGYDQVSLCWSGTANKMGLYEGFSEGNSTFYQCCSNGQHSLGYSLLNNKPIAIVPP